MRRTSEKPAPPRAQLQMRPAEAGNDLPTPAGIRIHPSPLSSFWRGAGGAAARPLLLVAGVVMLIAGAACSGTNNGYSAKAAPPAPAASQAAIATQPASASPAPLVSVTPLTATAATPAMSPSAGPAAAPAAAPLAVSIAGFAFAPATLHVPVGGSVTWTNNDAVTHTVTPDAGGIDAHELAPGAGFTQTFTSPGTYSYHCAIHPFMKGSIVVG